MLGKIYLSTLFVTLISLLLITANTSGATWNTEVVDSIEKIGRTSIAIDSSGNVHISYFDRTNEDLKYATNASGSWVAETVDSSGDVGRTPSIAIDSSGNVHISYLDFTNEDLKYATNASGSWATNTVDSAGKVGWYSSIAIDSSDNIHISYLDNSKWDLKYATNAPGSWVTETVDSTGNVGIDTSIAIDSSDNVHISHYDSTNDVLKYATNATGLWVTETVDSDGDVGIDTSIALDSSGNVHIIYYDRTNEVLKYATNATGSWVTHALDVGGWSSLAIDSSDNVHISYSVTHALGYATNATGSWVTEKAVSGGYTCLYTSIALDSSDNVHISYVQGSNLKYATTGDGTCTFSISPASQSFGSDGGYNNSISMTTTSWCDWTASSNISWITITSAGSGGSVNGGTGSGIVKHYVSPNTSANSRTGTMTIAGETFTVTQAGACTFSISPASQSFSSSGGTDSVSVIAPDVCNWTASSNVSWITITTISIGSSNGTVSYSVSPNTNASSRTGTMIIAGKTFTVTQAGTYPLPDIKANSSDGPVTISQGDLLTVIASLNPGIHDGGDADWWVAIVTPFGLYWLTSDSGWVRSDTPIRAYGGPLFNLPTYTILEISTLPVGKYTFYFAVDTNMNGLLDSDLYYNGVVVNITP